MKKFQHYERKINFQAINSNEGKKTLKIVGPVGWGYRMYRLHLCRGVRLPPMSVSIMRLNNLIVRFQ